MKQNILLLGGSGNLGSNIIKSKLFKNLKSPIKKKLNILNKNKIQSYLLNNKINLVVGCGGERDFKKRALMERIAEKYSNKVYLTDDNPRNEDPKKIRIETKKGFRKIKVLEISNRKKAIF